MKFNNLQVICSLILLFSMVFNVNVKTFSAGKNDPGSILLKNGWYLQSSEKVQFGGDKLSLPDYKTDGWYPTQVPATVMAALVKNGVYKDVFVGRNLASIPTDQFTKSWWYRNEFVLQKKPGMNTVKLDLDGINYRANVWLNGKLVAKSDTTEGAFRRFSLDISSNVIWQGRNILAIEVFPPVPGEPTIGFVDWNPKAPDKNMGLFREVKLKLSGDVSINNPQVRSKVDLQTYKNANINIITELQNNSTNSVDGIISGEIGTLKFSKNITLQPKEIKKVAFLPEDYNLLNIKNPKLWWTNDFGKPDIYKLKLQFHTKKGVSDEKTLRFGIREVSDYFTEDGHKGYKLNGKNILIRGGGWVDNLFLDNSYENYEAQINYAKHMNLNTIRLEGFWGNNDDLYDLCDENGILIMAGWSCQWEWPASLGKETDQYGGIKSPEDMKLIARSWKDQITWLRNHPSVFLWLYGSDMTPRPELESMYQDILKNEDPTRPFLAAASRRNSTVTGSTGVKMLGPYDYVTPNYWYLDTKYGGAYGFNTETGPGPQVPPIESIKKMIPQDSLWPINKMYDYHCGGNAFNTLDRYNEMMDQRMGKSSNLDEYCWKAQYLNYEGMRAMFEAFAANRYKATGVIQWMYNAAWPKFWWQLYDYYLNPNGAFYGAKKACEPLHIQYNYGTNGVDLVNNTQKEFRDLKADIKILDINMKARYTKSISVNAEADKTVNLDLLPLVSDTSKIFFTDLRLFDKNNKLVSSNFYCLSTKPDVLDTAKTNWYVTPAKEYGDFSELNHLTNVQLKVNNKIKKDGDKHFVTVELSNPTDKLAFLVNLNIIKGNSNESVLPIFWDDNYFSLLPGEKRIINGYFYSKDLEGKHPNVSISGWNIK